MMTYNLKRLAADHPRTEGLDARLLWAIRLTSTSIHAPGQNTNEVARMSSGNCLQLIIPISANCSVVPAYSAQKIECLLFFIVCFFPILGTSRSRSLRDLEHMLAPLGLCAIPYTLSSPASNYSVSHQIHCLFA
jgi:hypothetical protein